MSAGESAQEEKLVRLDCGGARVKAARSTCCHPGLHPASWAKGQDIVTRFVCQGQQALSVGVHGVAKHWWGPTVEGGGWQHPLQRFPGGQTECCFQVVTFACVLDLGHPKLMHSGCTVGVVS